MADKRIADDFLYGNREQRKERRTLRKKNLLERKVYKKNAKKLGDPRTYTNATLKQMKVNDKGEMSALINAQEVYTPIWNAQSNLNTSLSNLNAAERSLSGAPQTTISGNNQNTGILNVSNEKQNGKPKWKFPVINAIKDVIGDIKENKQTRNLRKKALKEEYNQWIEDLKLTEGDNFNEDRVPSYRKWKKKWNAGDFVGNTISDEDRDKLKALEFNKGKPIEEQKVFHNGKYILRSELEKTINPVTGGNIQERETAVLENRPEKFSDFDHLTTWQNQAGDNKFKEGESVTVGGQKYTWKKRTTEGTNTFGGRTYTTAIGELHWVADITTYKNMSFKKAFRKARNAHGGHGGEFIWNGKYYHTGYGSESSHTPSKEARASWGQKRKGGVRKKHKGGCKKCGGMYQDGGFLESPIPRLFE